MEGEGGLDKGTFKASPAQMLTSHVYGKHSIPRLFSLRQYLPPSLLSRCCPGAQLVKDLSLCPIPGERHVLNTEEPEAAGGNSWTDHSPPSCFSSHFSSWGGHFSLNLVPKVSCPMGPQSPRFPTHSLSPAPSASTPVLPQMWIWCHLLFKCLLEPYSQA